jgi:hypothetical protein
MNFKSKIFFVISIFITIVPVKDIPISEFEKQKEEAIDKSKSKARKSVFDKAKQKLSKKSIDNAGKKGLSKAGFAGSFAANMVGSDEIMKKETKDKHIKNFKESKNIQTVAKSVGKVAQDVSLKTYQLAKGLLKNNKENNENNRIIGGVLVDTALNSAGPAGQIASLVISDETKKDLGESKINTIKESIDGFKQIGKGNITRGAKQIVVAQFKDIKRNAKFAANVLNDTGNTAKNIQNFSNNQIGKDTTNLALTSSLGPLSLAIGKKGREELVKDASGAAKNAKNLAQKALKGDIKGAAGDTWGLTKSTGKLGANIAKNLGKSTINTIKNPVAAAKGTLNTAKGVAQAGIKVTKLAAKVTSSVLDKAEGAVKSLNNITNKIIGDKTKNLILAAPLGGMTLGLGKKGREEFVKDVSKTAKNAKNLAQEALQGDVKGVAKAAGSIIKSSGELGINYAKNITNNMLDTIKHPKETIKNFNNTVKNTGKKILGWFKRKK